MPGETLALDGLQVLFHWFELSENIIHLLIICHIVGLLVFFVHFAGKGDFLINNGILTLFKHSLLSEYISD